MAISTLETCSKRRLLAYTSSVVETTTGSNLKIVCDVTPSTFPPFHHHSLMLIIPSPHYRAIEDNALTVCGNLVAECIVVGSGRPSPVMFIEPGVDMDHGKLKKEIIRKTRHFHSRRYLHERIISPDMIVIVPRHSLPRTATKGNIRRKAVEEAYKPLLDQIYSRLH